MPFKDFVAGSLSNADLNAYIMSQCVIRCTSSTRPDFSVGLDDGWHIYETDTHRLMVWRDNAWNIAGSLDTFVVKPSDESSASTSDHTDADLVVPVDSDTIYMWDAFLCVVASANGTVFDLDFTYPSGSTITYVTNHAVSAEEGTINKVTRRTGAVSTNIFVSTNGTATQCMGMLTTGSTSGNFSFRWRTTNGATTLTVKANSMLRVRRAIDPVLNLP